MKNDGQLRIKDANFGTGVELLIYHHYVHTQFYAHHHDKTTITKKSANSSVIV